MSRSKESFPQDCLPDRLAIFYDGNPARHIPAGVKSNMNRDIGLAWLNLPLVPPEKE